MDVRRCNYCREAAELTCTRCCEWYCSQKCQTQHWPQHKLFCFPMPSLVKPPEGVTFVKSEPKDEALRPPSPSSKFRNLKLTNENDAISKGSQQSLFGSTADSIPKTNGSAKSNDILANKVPLDDNSSKTGQQPLSGNKGNIPKSNDTVKDDGISTINVPSANAQQEDKISTKPAYYKTDKVNAASIRKPGTLSQVMPKPVQPPKQDKVEPPKQVKVEPPKQQITEPPKQQKVEPPKQPMAEPPKQQKVEPPKQQKVEPPKQPMAEPPKHQKVEPPKQAAVEPPKQQITEQKIDLPRQEKVDPPKKIESALPNVELQKNGPWMKPFPMEEGEFVEVTIQYVAPGGVAWVSLVETEADNTNMLRKCNKIASFAPTASPTAIQVNSLFLVPFEDIYYRGVVLKPVTGKDTVVVRLVDFGNEFELPIGQLKAALPSVSEANAYAFPIKFQRPRNPEIGTCTKVKKVLTEGDVITVIVEGEPDVPPITMKDIDMVPIPEGVKQNLICLDFSNVGSGYVSLCISDSNALKYIQEMGPRISQYCEETKDEYCPQVGEICLAKFEDEGWFRALTLKVIESNKFEIMFIDYGNNGTVDSSVIRKMTDDFTYPCLMNPCYIQGYPKAPTKEDIRKAAHYFDENSAFCADKIEKIGDKYFVSVTF